MITECLHDCKFYSAFTETCDYRLMRYEARGCPVTACTRYERRTQPREWMVFTRHSKKEGDSLYSQYPIPEPPLNPPEPECVTADCGHEVYDGEDIYSFERETLCPDCMEERFNELSTREKAELLGCGYRVVSFGREV